MLDLILSEDFVLAVPLGRAREICERAIIALDWNLHEQSQTKLLAREKGLWGVKGLGTKTSDLALLLNETEAGTRVKLTVSHNYGKTWGNVLRPMLQDKMDKIREGIAGEIPGGVRSSMPPPLPTPSSPLVSSVADSIPLEFEGTYLHFLSPERQCRCHRSHLRSPR